MQEILGLVLACLGVFAFVYLFSMIVVMSRLVKLQLWSPMLTAVAREEAQEVLPILDAARPVLEEQGFRYVNTRRLRAMDASMSGWPQYTDTYYHPTLGVQANVMAAGLPTPRAPYEITLWNSFKDGRALATMNGQSALQLTVSETVTLLDPCVTSFSQQLAEHLKARALLSQVPLDEEEIEASSLAMSVAILPEMRARGEVYPCGEINGEPVYGLRLLAAVRAAWRMRGGFAKIRALEKLRDKEDRPPVAPPEVRRAADRLAFVGSLLTLNNLRTPRWFRWSAFVLSAAAFIGIGAWLWGIAIALVIAAVVVVHEGGHWLAMRLAGFRDLQVFFVPGMGAVASGEKHEASPLTLLAVFLAGPLPGLLLAMAGIVWLVFGQPDSSAWYFGTLRLAIGVSFLINLFNLAPLMPLDGGRVIDLFVMARLPWFRFGFALLSGVLLLGMGIVTGDKLLMGLGILAFVAMAHQFRMAKVSRALLRQTASAPLADEAFPAAHRLFDFLSGPEYAKWHLQTKLAVAQTILPRFLGRLPNVRETAIGLSIYIASIMLPLGMVGWLALKQPEALPALMSFGDASLAERPAPRVQAVQDMNDATLAATVPAQRIKVLGELASLAAEEDNFDEAVRLGRLYYQETKALPAPSQLHAAAAFELASALRSQMETSSDAEAQNLLKEADGLLRERLSRKRESGDALLLSRVLGAREPSGNTAAIIAVRQEIVDLNAAYPKESGHGLVYERVSLAHAFFDAGRLDQAQEQLTLARIDLERLPEQSAFAANNLALDHGWFLMATQRPREARQHLQPFLARTTGANAGIYSFNRNGRLLAAVAARAQGQWDEVKAQLVPIQTHKPYVKPNWLARLLDKEGPLRFDLSAGLLLAEAERQLGNGAAADKLVADMRKQYTKEREGKPACFITPEYDEWREGLNTAVRENEKREFKCEDPPPSLSCPAPAVVPDN